MMFTSIIASIVAPTLVFLINDAQSFVLPNTLPGSPSMSHYRGAEEFFDGVEDGADDAVSSKAYYRSPYYDSGVNYPENDGYLFGGFPEIPGVIGGGAGFYEDEEPGVGNGEIEKLNMLLALEKPARWSDLHSFLERQEKKLVDVGHLAMEPAWPKLNVTKQMAATSGVALCHQGIVHGLHRAGRQWFEAFDLDSKTKKDLKPIDKNVVISIDPKTGTDLKKSWGKNLFYLPHGISIDHEGNFWITDVAAHQVFKFPWSQRDRPSLVLGERFVSGSDAKHFCKPTDVAVAASTGDIFIADGYCNSRVLKLDKNGKVLTSWGKKTPAKLQGPKAPKDSLTIPHSIHLDESRDLVCVADRENLRIVCFDAGLKKARDTGKVRKVFTNENFGRIFAVTISSKLGVLYAVSGSVGEQPSQGFTIDLESGEVLDRWTKTPSTSTSSSPPPPSSGGAETASASAGFGEMPHDVEVSPVDGDVYVAQVNEGQITKFKHVQY